MIENKDKWAREIAAQCWCDKETENKTMDVSLAMAVAKRIAFAYDEGRKAERERCLEIARGYSSCEGIAQKIAKEIMEAQDGE